MSISKIKNRISDSGLVKEVFRQIESEKRIFIKGLSGSLKALFLSLLIEKTNSPVVYVTGDDEQEEIVKEDLETILGHEQVAFFPKIRELANSEVVYESNKKSQLLSALEKLVEKRNVAVVVPAKNIVHKFPQPKFVKKERLSLKAWSEYNFENLKERLSILGFEREQVVEDWGEMSVRGGIIDVFPYSSDNPFRIEFSGDQIESIRIFDPTTQRSIKNVNQITIYPQNIEEKDEQEGTTFVSLLEYFDQNAVVFLDETEIIHKEIEDFFLSRKMLQDKSSPDRSETPQENHFLRWEDIQEKLSGLTTIHHDSFQSSRQNEYIDFTSQPQDSFKGSFPLLRKKIDYYFKQKSSISKSNLIYFLCESNEQIQRMEELFLDSEIDIDKIQFAKFGLNQGFVFQDAGLVLFTDNHFYGRPIRWRRRKKVRGGLTIQQLNSLSIGDFVVHVDKGIGEYAGLKKITVQGHERECLSLIYRDGDLLYVPLERMDRIQKYSAKEGFVPALSKLGNKNWDRLKKRTKKHIKDLAKELTALYAQRKNNKGFGFSTDTLWQKELEASFEYDDTPDQVKATLEIKEDMESDLPMDRLICGDVGYGKTEVAIRAAFKAVNDGKQVVVLVPTTILALQHYNLIRERLRQYPAVVDLLSRFRTRSEQMNVVEKLKSGQIDIVIGTHRMLSKDVNFKNLGLLIIDEEHRFGVAKKENLKKKYLNVDVLSMSATPIPRTLNMALLGVRDMSMIATPPRDRHPIITEVTPFSLDLVRMAILKEIDRGGQVFFVHNRVQTIESITNNLRKHIPEISFAIAHGQMDERQLEKVMWDFAHNKYQCLVSTMIIESGLDIPNVNTLIINRADRFGLSQLYQLRGRVGRSNQTAYAYLLIPPVSSLKRNALKRLRIIEEFSDLGSGFNVAMRDLEIRGAGNILGAEQSGHIVALGYELYSKIIEEAAYELKLEKEGKPIPENQENDDVKVEINEDAFLPDEYIDQPELKVDIYRRLANETEITKITGVRDELKDRFGTPPEPVENLFLLIELKLLGRQLDFKQIKVSKNNLTAYFSEKITTTNNGELIEKKVSSIIDKTEGKFHFIQDRKKGFGVSLDIPSSEKKIFEYGKNFLKNLL